MSKINLPPLPCEVGLVRALFRGQPDYFTAQDSYYTQDQMRAYAEQAVRQALAAQEAVAWISMVDGHPVDRPSRDRWLIERSAASWTGGHVSALAIIPDPAKEPPYPPTSDSGHPT